MARHEVDARRLLCPMPVIRLQEQVSKAQAGDQVEIVFTDPGGKHDIPAWCRVHGHKVLDSRQDQLDYYVTVEVCYAPI